MIASHTFVAGVLAAVLAAGSPTPAPTPDAEAVAEAQQKVDDALAAAQKTDVTDAMRTDATLALDAADATFPLDADDATTVLETRATEGTREVVRLTSDLLFDFGKATLTKAAADAVRRLAADLPKDADVSIVGYTDSVGSASDNLTLSRARAQAVADVLAEARPDLTLTVSGRGEEDPVQPNTVGGDDNPAGRAANRRVEVSYTAAE